LQVDKPPTQLYYGEKVPYEPAKVASSPEVTSEPAFPDGWWKTDTAYSLQRRAIISKQWIYITHTSHFAKPGDYHTFSIAQYPIFLIQGKDNAIRAFHNVCRHRAYTVATKTSGSSTVLGCRYHGWSYNTRGRLVKAPQFEDISGFDRSQNSLFEIHCITTKQGFVFVNLDSGGDVEEMDCRGIETLAKTWRVSARSTPVGRFEVEKSVDWKTAGSTQRYPPNSASTIPELYLSSIKELFSRQPGQEAHYSFDKFSIASFHVLPASAVWYTLSILPLAAGKTVVRGEVYSDSKRVQTANSVEAITKIVEAEIEALLNEAGNYEGGNTENTDRIYITISAALHHHIKQERTVGKEIYPASREPRKSERYDKAD
ncbi:ISP domain-containing protein, partial [Saccharata proteae CBS 121410]